MLSERKESKITPGLWCEELDGWNSHLLSYESDMGTVERLLRECVSLGWKSHMYDIASTSWCYYMDDRDLGAGLEDWGLYVPFTATWRWCLRVYQLVSSFSVIVPSKMYFLATPGALLLRPSFSHCPTCVKHSWGCWLEFWINSPGAHVMYHLAPEILGKKFTKLTHLEVLWIQ